MFNDSSSENRLLLLSPVNTAEFDADLTSRDSFSSANEEKSTIDDLRKQNRMLESQYLALNRAVPRMQNNRGEDVTEEMVELYAQLAHALEARENWENMYAKKDQELSAFKHKYREDIENFEQQLGQMKARGRELEKENETLQKQVDNDASKIFRMERERGAGREDISYNEAEQSLESETIDHMREELEMMHSENMRLMDELVEAKERLIQSRHIIEKQAEALKKAVAYEEFSLWASIFGMDNNVNNLPEHNCNNSERVIAKMLMLLEKLDGTDLELNELRSQILKFFNENGIAVDRSNVSAPIATINALRNLCCQLFGKLRETAGFLQSLLETLEGTEDGHEIIAELRLELDTRAYRS